MAAAKKRSRSKHPGVKLKKRALFRVQDGERLPNGFSWRAIYRDPDTNKDVYVTLDDGALGSAEARREWAVRKSKTIAKRRMELEDGAPRATGTPLKDAVEKFFTANSHLRTGTTDLYRQIAAKLEAWAATARVASGDDVTRTKLAEFRHAIIVEPLRKRAHGGRRGEMEATSEKRSPHTINSELRRLGTILRYLHELDLLPKITEQDIRRSLKRVPAPLERVDYLRSADLNALLECALRHDEQCYAETRAEHVGAGRRAIGTTRRYAPIAPLITYLALTGCRLGEALDLTWDQVDLDATNGDGVPVGEIHLSGATNKTHRARTVDLEVSPACRRLLLALRGDGEKRAEGTVFGLTEGVVDAEAKRLRSQFSAPTFSFQALRRTAGTFLTNAPSIFHGASAYKSAKQLGHSVQVAERHYLGLERGIPKSAETLEAAMQIEGLVAQVIERVAESTRAGEPHPSLERRAIA